MRLGAQLMMFKLGMTHEKLCGLDRHIQPVSVRRRCDGGRVGMAIPNQA